MQWDTHTHAHAHTHMPSMTPQAPPQAPGHWHLLTKPRNLWRGALHNAGTTQVQEKGVCVCVCVYKLACQMRCAERKEEKKKIRKRNQGVLTNKGECKWTRWMEYSSCRFFTRPPLPLLLSASKSFAAFRGGVEPGPFHHNGYPKKANISEHAVPLTSTAWPPARVVAPREACSSRPSLLDDLQRHEPKQRRVLTVDLFLSFGEKNTARSISDPIWLEWVYKGELLLLR